MKYKVEIDADYESSNDDIEGVSRFIVSGLSKFRVRRIRLEVREGTTGYKATLEKQLNQSLG